MKIDKLINDLSGALKYIDNNYDYGDDEEKEAITSYVNSLDETIQFIKDVRKHLKIADTRELIRSQ